MTKKKVPKGDIYKTDDGAKLLLDNNDPKFRKRPKPNIVTTKKPKAIIIHRNTMKPHPTKPHKYVVARKIRPIIGLLVSPYLLFRPLLRLAAKLGNKQFDKVFCNKA